MAKYLFLYRGGERDMNKLSPQQMQQVIERWMGWIQQAQTEGWMINGGDALQPVGCVVGQGGTVTDGPFAESKELIGGYSVVQADDLATAAGLAADCPVFDAGGVVEVRAIAQFD